MTTRIPEDLLMRAKIAAAKTGMTLEAIVAEGMRKMLKELEETK